MKQFRNRLATEWLALALGLSLLVGLAGGGGWLSRLDLVFYDLALTSWLRPAPDDIVIVAADEASLAAIGRWPWRRAVHATLLDRLTAGGAKVVGLDILLDDADGADAGSDAALADAMAKNGRVVLPVTQGPGEGGGAEAIRPIPAFAARAAALGFADVRLDADGIARSVWLAEGPGHADTPHFAYAVLQVAQPRQFPKRVPQPDGAGPWRRAWPMFIPYAGPPGHFRTVSYVDVLLGKVPPETFRDKLVLVGVTAAGIGDNNPVPTSGNGRVMAGVEISANVIDALRRDVAIRSLPPVMTGIFGALAVLCLLTLLRRTSPRTGLLLSLGAGVALVLLSGLLLRFGQAWTPPAAALAGCTLAYPLWSWRRLEAAQRYLDGELALLADGGILPGTAPEETGRGGDAIERRIDVVRVAAERQRDARRFLADTLESLPAGMLVADRTGKVVLANRRAAELLDLRPGRYPLGVPLAELLARLKPVAGDGDARLGGGDSWKALKMEVSSASASNLLLDVAPCRGDGGRYLGLVASLTDVAELRAAQKSRDESMRFLSHDLRSPLTTIVTLLDAAADEAPAAGPQHTLLLERIGSYARRSLALADDMLRLGRAEAADPASFLELDLRAVLEEAADEVWPVAQSHGILLAANLQEAGEDDEALARGDGEMLRRAFVNLLGNAVKYSQAGSRVELGLARQGSDWRVTVADQGRGIPADKLPRLFTRYGRFPASQDYVEGIGLGLVIVKAVIDAHGGAIEVDSAEGRGTRFLVSIPGIA